jgi:DNA polymerase/3'-5' exonuclease PolX
MEPKVIEERTKILKKYKKTRIVDLMDDVKEKIGAVILKFADMNDNDAEEFAVTETLLQWSNDLIENLTRLHTGVQYLKDYGKKSESSLYTV